MVFAFPSILLALGIVGALGPGLTNTVAVLGFNLVGDGIRDALNPRLAV